MILTNKNYEGIIFADEISIGKNVKIGKNVIIRNIDGKNSSKICIGDNVFIGDNTIILVPEFSIGDYSTIHRHTRISGYKKCIIGHNFWIDQNCILNSTDELIIGNNVGVGAYSQLWTHIKYGDILEGCRFNSTKPMIIEDDVWFVGHCIVSPVHAKKKSMAMVGSVITKNMEENTIYAGSPAKSISEKIGPQFSNRTFEEKEKMFIQKLKAWNLFEEYGNKIIPVKDYPSKIKDDSIYFNLKERTYTKKGFEFEFEFMRYLLPEYKFIPKSLLPANDL